ncbi:hypothetical protein MPSEU_001013800 [Mayamaea pseudoterrestris]|nr:hypothetical protein MPSEU_001013800 [Mayamaea pseudoterrestris]
MCGHEVYNKQRSAQRSTYGVVSSRLSRFTDMKAPQRTLQPTAAILSWNGAPLFNSMQTQSQKNMLDRYRLISCRGYSDECLTRRVVHESIQFKKGIQRIQETPSQAMPCIFDPLDLRQFAMLETDQSGSHSREGPHEHVYPSTLRPDGSRAWCGLEVDDGSAVDEAVRQHPISLDLAARDANAACPDILSAAQFQVLQHALPRRFRDAVFQRRFCLAEDGDRLDTLLHMTKHVAETIIVMETTTGDLLGGYCTEPWGGKMQYHGNGQTFLFATNAAGGEDFSGKGLCIYPWSGKNDYCQVCGNFLAMGGQGSFGWRVCSQLMKGQTGWCQTYENPPLVEGGFFDIANLEVYAIVPLLLSKRRLKG